MKAAIAKAWDSLESHPRRGLLVAFSLAVLLRIPFLGAPLQADEGGFLMVAGQWNDEGSALYGDQWVDRPPLLLVVFRLAVLLGGDVVTLRLIAVLCGLITVAAAWWAGRAINGARGGIAAALVAAAISSSFGLDGFALTGESIAVAFVMTSCAMTLHAASGSTTGRGLDKLDRRGAVGLGRLDRPSSQALLLAVGAGLLASMAFLVKQNFIDAGLFALILLGSAAHRSWRVLGAGAVGIAVPLVATAAWARSDEGPGLIKLWHALFRFRQRAFGVVEGAASSAPLQRLEWLLVLFVASGLALLTWQLLRAMRRADGPVRLKVALLAMLAYGLVSISVGASWWSHYLLQLGPVLAIGTALATRRSLPRLRTHLAAIAVTLASVVACVVGVGQEATAQASGTSDQIVGQYLKAASRPGDTLVLAYGTPSIIETSGLSTPYRYAWSLPIRARDRHLTELVATLNGHSAPTWLVEIGDFNWWGLDTQAFQETRAARYHVVATVCAHDVYLHNGLVRSLPPTPPCP